MAGHGRAWHGWYLEGAVDLAVLHQVAAHDALLFLAMIVLRGLDVLGQIQLDVAQVDPLALATAGILLQDLEVNPRLLQHLVLADDKAHGQLLVIVKDDLVVLDEAFGGASAVFGGSGRGQVPFDEAGARDQRHVVEVEDAQEKLKLGLARRGPRVSSVQSRVQCKVDMCVPVWLSGLGRWSRSAHAP